MTAKQATVQVFLTAFRALPKDEQSAFLFTIIKDSHLNEDVIDLAIAVKRSSEKTKRFGSFLRHIDKTRRAS